jgi:hypothetical protein
MKPLVLADLAGLEEYERVRDAYRSAVIAHKRVRRIPVGEKVTLVFEDRETLRFQIQEMLRIERIASPEKVQLELDVYNELMPGDAELSATLFVEITDLADIRPELDRLIGIDEHVLLEVGDHAVRATFDPKQMEEDRLSAVQYIRFALAPEPLAAFLDPAQPAAVHIDHPAYDERAELSAETRASLCVDLAGEPAPLLSPSGVADPGADALITTERVRAVPAELPDHVVVEPRGAAPGLLEADPELLAELFEVARRVAIEWTRRHGACRIQADAGPDAPTLRLVVRPR